MALSLRLFPYLLATILATRMTVANYTQHNERSARANLISFQPMNKTLLLGLDLLVPFITVPTGKNPVDEFGFPKALMNIDTGAVVISSLVTGGALIMGHLFRSFPLIPAESKEEAADLLKTSRSGKRLDDTKLTNIFEPFKLIYTNVTGGRVETSLGELMVGVENSFQDHDLDFAACLEKSICCMVKESGDQLKAGQATGLHKIIDGITQLNWLLGLLQHTTLLRAIEAGRMGSSAYCDVKYPRCRWATPQVKIQHFFKNSVKFT